MSTASEDGPRIAPLDLGEDFVLYDRENHNAWVQSTVFVEVENVR